VFQGATSPGQLTHIAPYRETTEPSLAGEIPNVSFTYYVNNNEPLLTNAAMPLHLELRRARIHCHGFDYFVPLSDIKRIITASVIQREIQVADPTMSADAATYASKIEESGRKLFAILAYRQNGPAIRSLLESNLSDQDLPFPHKMVDGQCSLWRRKPEECIGAFEQWDNEEVEEFARMQWWMIAPVFDKNSRTCLELADEVILPFIHVEENEKKDEGIPQKKIGGYSEVTAFRVHPAHHNFFDSSIPLVRSLVLSLKSVTNST
jgi:hypothetical protein